MAVVIGSKSIVTEKGDKLWQIHYLSSSERGINGYSANAFWVSDSKLSGVVPCVGQQFEIVYGRTYNGKAFVDYVRFDEIYNETVQNVRL